MVKSSVLIRMHVIFPDYSAAAAPVQPFKSHPVRWDCFLSETQSKIYRMRIKLYIYDLPKITSGNKVFFFVSFDKNPFYYNAVNFMQRWNIVFVTTS